MTRRELLAAFVAVDGAFDPKTVRTAHLARLESIFE